MVCLFSTQAITNIAEVLGEAYKLCTGLYWHIVGEAYKLCTGLYWHIVGEAYKLCTGLYWHIVLLNNLDNSALDGAHCNWEPCVSLACITALTIATENQLEVQRRPWE